MNDRRHLADHIGDDRDLASASGTAAGAATAAAAAGQRMVMQFSTAASAETMRNVERLLLRMMMRLLMWLIRLEFTTEAATVAAAAAGVLNAAAAMDVLLGQSNGRYTERHCTAAAAAAIVRFIVCPTWQRFRVMVIGRILIDVSR